MIRSAPAAAPRLLILLSAIGLAGCGDAILCDSSPLVVIQAPASAITIDGDSAAAGIQTDVRVRSTLLPTDELELTVLDGAGAEVATVRQPAGEGGTTVFAGVTVPGPRATLRATARSACGFAEDAIDVDVVAGTGCELALTPAPQAMPAYPIGVLNAALDPDPTPGFQAQLAITTRPGFLVEIYANMGQGEQLLAEGLADAMGIARSPLTLVDGPASLRAVCRGARGEILPSSALSVQVDVTPPSCDFRSPAPGTSITPDLDQDGDPTNGVQLAVEAYVGGGDAAGEPVQLTVTTLEGSSVVQLTPVDAQGLSTGAVTLAPPSPMMPAPFELEIATQDRAGNPCVTTRPYEVVYDGCPIQVLGPTATVTADADGNAANGSQVDVQLDVAPLCAGRTVTSTCGLNSPQGVVPSSGPLTLRVDLCGSSPCETSAACTFRVASAAGVQTQASATIAFDDQGPTVGVQVVQPQLACGGQIAPADDADPATPGVQLVARVTAPGGVSPTLELTNIGGTTTLPAAGDVAVTVAPGLNLLTGEAFDALGNRGRSAACTIALADMAVAVAPPAADGFVGRADGTVSGSTLAFRLAGTVDRTGAAVTARVDGGAAVPATVSGTTWFVDLSLAEAPHAVVVTATKGTSFGRAALPLAVDLTPPPAVGAPGGSAPTRQRVALAWTAPDDGGGPAAAYVVKWSTAAMTDAGFDAQGTAIPTGAPRAPGSLETAELSPARTGTPYWLGVAAVDRAGNRSPAAIVGPITPAFDQLGPFVSARAGSDGQLSLGAAIAHGRFNDDEFDDLAIAAPTQSPHGIAQAGVVYVYFGRPTGIAAAPDLTIEGGAAGALTGAGLAAVRWQSATHDDLVIGAPGADGGAGRLFVLAGGAGFPTGTVAAASAALQIGVNAAAPGWFAGGGLGAAAVAADVDGDGVRDLVASAIRGGGGSGGIVIFYGGTVTGSLALSDTDPSGLGGAVVQYMPDPLALTGRKLGTYLHAVEPTGGPLDIDDDLVVGYEDSSSTTDSVYVLRGNGTRPAAGLSPRPFTPGRDVRLDLTTVYGSTEFGAQAVTIADHNGDGAADLVISAYKDLNGGGQVYVIDGDTIGTSGVARLTDPGVVLTTIRGASGMRLGAVLVAHDELSDDDVDGDGRRDLMVGGVEGLVAYLYVWFGGTLPRGLTSVATAGTKIRGPSTFQLSSARPQGPAGQGLWAGDLNGDGLDDVCWASPYDNATMLDGSFAVLLDGVLP
jgi:hypothetical protein